MVGGSFLPQTCHLSRYPHQAGSSDTILEVVAVLSLLGFKLRDVWDTDDLGKLTTLPGTLQERPCQVLSNPNIRGRSNAVGGTVASTYRNKGRALGSPSLASVPKSKGIEVILCKIAVCDSMFNLRLTIKFLIKCLRSELPF